MLMGVALEALYTTVGPFSMLESVPARPRPRDRVPPAPRKGARPGRRSVPRAEPGRRLPRRALQTLRAKALVAWSYARRAR
jgi:hypothetical protein